MKNTEKYQGIIPAFYACYDEHGKVDGERVELLTRHMVKKVSKASMWAVPPENAFTRPLQTGN